MIAPPPLIAIAGPTASGKTSLAIRLARELNGQIISVDSMQVYRGLNVGTAKPPVEERAGIPHHGFDLAHPTERFDANNFAASQLPVLESLARTGTPAILAGGTGLYFRSLLEGLDPAPSCNPGFRRELERQAEEKGPEVLHERLRAVDLSRAAELHPNDLRRVIRALEIAEFAHKRPSTLREGGARSWSKRTLYIVLDPGQEVLRERIVFRLRQMLREGLLAEVAWLLELGWESVTTASQAVGYKEFVPYFDGSMSLGDCLSIAAHRSARLAARQRSWFRHQIDGKWFPECEKSYPQIRKEVTEYLETVASL